MQRHEVTALGGESGEILWRGHRVAFTRHGQGSPVLLVHGLYAGASSLEWRHTVPALSERHLADRHTVFALDLLGFGRSDRPAARYSPGLYQALLADVVARVVRDDCAVVASGLSAAQVIALATRDPGRIASVALVAPTGVAHLREVEPTGSRTARLLLGAPLIGNTAYNRLTSPARMRDQLRAMYFDDRLVTPELVEEYVRSAQEPGGKHALGALLDGRLNVDVRAAVRRLRLPTLLLWGDVARQKSGRPRPRLPGAQARPGVDVGPRGGGPAA